MRRAYLLLSALTLAGCGGGEDFSVQSDAGGAGADGGADAPSETSGQPDVVGSDSQSEDVESDAANDVQSEVTTESGVTCDPGTADCDEVPANGCEVTTDTDIAHCGGCGKPCVVGENATPVCEGGVCDLACDQGFADCDEEVSTGCEADLESIATCGACDRVCGQQNAQAECSGGTCELDCEDGFADCNGEASDGCEVALSDDASNCGWCEHDCDGNACANGLCEPTILAVGLQGVIGIDLDATDVYFTAVLKKEVGRVPKIGGSVQTLLTNVSHDHIRVESSHVYLVQGIDSPKAIYRFPKNGPYAQSMITDNQLANRFAVDDVHVYFTNASHEHIYRVPKAGGTPVSIVAGQDLPVPITLTQSEVLWGLYQEGEIRSMPKSGGAVTTLATGTGMVGWLGTDQDYLYWAGLQGIERVLLEGGGRELITATEAHVAAVYNAYVYFVDGPGGSVRAVSKGGGEVKTYSAGLDYVLALAVDEDFLYFADSFGPDDGSIMRVPK